LIAMHCAMIHSKIVLTILSGAVALAAAPERERRRSPIIRQTDHIIVESHDPGALFGFFTSTLQLPEAWSTIDNGRFASGGVGAGNVNLGFYKYSQSPAAKPSEISRSKFSRARYAGLAFQPYPLTDALRELAVCGIAYGVPENQISTLPDGSQGISWTIVSLPSFSGPRMTVYLLEYSPKYLRVEVQRQVLGNRLALKGGGSLGLQSVAEIVIESTNLARDSAEWDLLLGKKTPSGILHAESGPSIRLVQGSADRIRELVFNVKSLQRAKRFLEKNQLLGPESSEPEAILLNPSKIQGLRILLKAAAEAQSAECRRF